MPSHYLYGDHLLGDALMQTPALRALKQAHPEASVQYLHGLTKPGTHMLLGNPHLDDLSLLREEVWAEQQARVPGHHVRLDAMEAFQWAVPQGKLLLEGFAAKLGLTLPDYHYDYRITPEEERQGRAWVASLGKRPVVVVARHSASCSSNDPRVGVANKCLPNRLWVQVARWLLKAGFTPVAVGSDKDYQDTRYREWPGQVAYGYPIRHLAAALPHCAGVLSVDTGIRHLAAATGAHLYCLSACIPLSLIRCFPLHGEQRIVEEYCPLPLASATRVIQGAEQILRL
jgi:hypothetical protein